MIRDAVRLVFLILSSLTMVLGLFGTLLNFVKLVMFHVGKGARPSYEIVELIQKWSIILGGLMFIATVALSGFIDPAKSISILSEWLVIPAAVAMAYFLFVLRRDQLTIYALVELTVGLAAIIYGVRWQNSDPLAKFLSIMSGMYIVIRGLDNIDKARERSQPREGVGQARSKEPATL